MRKATLDKIQQVCQDLVEVAEMVRADTQRVVATKDHIQLIRHYSHLRNATDSIKNSREALREIEEKLSRETIPEAFQNEGVTSVNVEGVGRVVVSYRYSCSMLKKQEAMQHLRDIGQEGLIQETVNSSTLSAFARNYLEEEGMELPDDLFRVSSSPYTSIRR